MATFQTCKRDTFLIHSMCIFGKKRVIVKPFPVSVKWVWGEGGNQFM